MGNAVGKDDERKHRARQNVVLELGMLLAKLGRPRVAILLKNQATMERPSDLQGLIYRGKPRVLPDGQHDPGSSSVSRRRLLAEAWRVTQWR
jgi:predicted nucleotide-binding protein